MGLYNKFYYNLKGFISHKPAGSILILVSNVVSSSTIKKVNCKFILPSNFSKMLTTDKSVLRVYRGSLYYSCKFPVGLKNFKLKC